MHPSPVHRILRWSLLVGGAALFAYFLLLPGMGRFLVQDSPPGAADVVVVLNTGVEYYPRLIQAAELVRTGRAHRVVINGNRKTPVLRRLEAMGFQPAAPWDEDRKRILELLGVGREQVVAVEAQDAYDTISEARAVAASLRSQPIDSVLLVTSKYHTRRAHFIWRRELGDSIRVTPVAAAQDPYDPNGWWRHGRQIRWVLAEYGGWLFLAWQGLFGIEDAGP